jgi:phosphoribosyl-ATP pyrophosphohydrolase
MEMQKAEEVRKHIESLEKMASYIYHNFLTKNSKALMLNNVIEHLEDKQRGQFNSEELLREQIKKLSEIVPEWIQINENVRGPIIKLKKNL